MGIETNKALLGNSTVVKFVSFICAPEYPNRASRLVKVYSVTTVCYNNTELCELRITHLFE